MKVKMKHIRWVVAGAIFIIVAVGLILNTNLGTLSSFGWQALATICPLGAIESMLASRTIFPRALIVLVVVVGIVVVFGKFFCSWVCPVAPVRSFAEAVRKRFKPGGKGRRTPSCSSGCSSCASGCTSKRPKIDSRHLVLGGSLLSAALFGFPVFCLLCPIGLIFGTVIVAWQFIGTNDVSLSLFIYPLLLILELLVFRRWCGRLCPMGAMLSLISLPNRFFKPVVSKEACIRAHGGTCNICSDICKEGIDPHCSEGMHECTKCGLCRDSCPTGAITFALFPKRDAYDTALADHREQEDGSPRPDLTL